MLVKAECLVKSWDSAEAFMFEPGGGPLPGGLYEIDTANTALTSMLTVGGKWVFQYDGHRGYPGRQEIAEAKEGRKKPPAVTKDKRKGAMSPERKEKLRLALAAAREAKKAKLEAAAA